MQEPDKRSREILSAARKAVSKIADPTLRARATAMLDATQKKPTSPRQQAKPTALRPQRIRDRDIDFDR